MPASIRLSNLTRSAPDGRNLLSNINLSLSSQRAGLVGRNGVGKTTLLKLISGELGPQSGVVSVRGSLGVLHQAVQVRAGDTVAQLFGAVDALALLDRAQAGDATPDELAGADWTVKLRICGALRRVGLDVDPAVRLIELSGGQCTRARLAALTFAEPDFLLLDEPTNDLDREGRRALIDLLATWRSGAIVISHDRELLEHMDAIVELTSLGATSYGGNWSAFRARKALDLAAAEHDLANAEKRVVETERRAQITAERKDRKDGAGRRKGGKGDLPRIVVGGRINSSEASGGGLARIAEDRLKRVRDDLDAARRRVEVLQPLHMTLPPTGLSPGKAVLRLDAVSAGFQTDHPIIRALSFSMTGPERVAVIGPNGSGKSTLLALIAGALQPWSGTVKVSVDFAMLDQRVSLLDSSLSIRENFRLINPLSNENACRAALARFMFRADAALTPVSGLSGGQLLRAGLACVLGEGRPPPLLILDEPTNHLDIDSIAAIEAGLKAFDGALLVVSHDESFLDEIQIERRLELPPRAAPS